MRNTEKTGYFIGVVGTSLVLIWIGLFKFTPTEAEAIKPLVEHHFLMRWMYSVFSVQGVSNVIGILEILVGVGLVLSYTSKTIGKYAGIGATVIFLVTLSFLFTTPGVWKTVDGFPVTDFFIVKDLAFLGVALMVWGTSKRS